MKDLKLGVESLDDFQNRTMDIARRLDKGDLRRRPAHHSFESAEQLLEVITPNRWRLIISLRKSGPSSIRALAKALGRDYRGVHADVTMLIEAGLIEKNDAGAILVPWSKITIEMESAVAA